VRTAKRILVIEDDDAIRRGLVDALAFAGCDVLEAADGERGKALAVGSDCDLVLLDLILPGCDGLDILAEVRATRPALPVIILTARGEEADRVRGLDGGADDYVAKPFSIRELLARVEAVLRRSAERPTDVSEVAVPGGVAHLELAEVRFEDGARAHLTAQEVALLRYLARSPGRVVSRHEILARDKLSVDGGAETPIRTVRGKGYVFEPREEAT